ncbi:DUF6452 family protein [uncultured Maribacter sp.]|uniref:DUF6452 family protein n=1 Tax=uncultured Maribacter sp. TaxID=431308 RepID=UPI0026348E3C|nr:DUF6452 family protein [uncultured Maribacter sp.]
MVKYKILGALLIGVILFLACEKDDICVDGDTPLLQIGFYDTTDTDTALTATSIRVIGEGQTNAIQTDSLKDRTDLKNISIPLKTVGNSTSFTFILDSEDDDNNNEIGNPDTVTFSYELGDEYVSRACGFIANYNGITATLTADSDNWIKGIEFIAADINLENINTTHVKIYH